MSAATAPVFRHAEMPPGPGKRVRLFIPDGNEMVTRDEPLLPGAGFTLNFSGDVWRSELRSALWGRDGVLVELEITGRYAA